MGELKLIDGKFYRDGNEVKAEFGNQEQIRLLKKANEMKEGGKTIGKITSTETTTYQPIVTFHCPACNEKVRIEDEFDTIEDYDPDNSDVDDYCFDCPKCHAELETQRGDDNKRNEIYIKIAE